MKFDIMITKINNIVLKLLWLEEFDSDISFKCQIIDFLTEKLVHMNKRLGSEIKICTISLNKLNKKIW